MSGNDRKYICNVCGNIVNLDNPRRIKSLGVIKKRRNYPFGKMSKVRVTQSCLICNKGIYSPVPKRKEDER